MLRLDHYEGTFRPLEGRQAPSGEASLQARGFALVPRRCRQRRSFGFYLVPPVPALLSVQLPEPSDPQGTHLLGFLLREAQTFDHSPDSELYQLSACVRIAQGLAGRVGGLDWRRRRAASVDVPGTTGTQPGELLKNGTFHGTTEFGTLIFWRGRLDKALKVLEAPIYAPHRLPPPFFAISSRREIRSSISSASRILRSTSMARR